ncbi:MAG: XRE family transcriptional regulator [Planctomycetota bacterium]|jgi:Zn-dependent peptidase ImmA (M78 family)/transcriptional regulator with XRE-family HTH domain
MGRSPNAEIDKSILYWARESSGIDVATAAKRAGTTPARIEEWEEEGGSYPTIKQLRKLAKAYMRPIGLFFLPELPEDPASIKDFRKIPDEFQEEMSSALRFEIRLAWDRREEAREMVADLDEEPTIIHDRFSLASDPDKIALKIRKMLGISTTQQMQWRTKYDAFNAWRQAVEQKGALVFQTGILRNLIVDPKEARGFSIAEQPYPVIVINSKDHPTARCFTLIHELTHILLADGGLCDLHNPFRATSHVDRTEVFCNRVAGSTLVPGHALLQTNVVQNHGSHAEWSDDELGELSKTFWVSWEVILRRLLILRKTTRGFYQRWRNERNDLFPGRETGGDVKIPTPTRVIIRNGRLFPALVLRALRNRRITSFRAADILGASADRLRDVETALFVSWHKSTA